MESFDLRETIIPFSLLQITNHFKRMKPGQVVEIIGSDASVAADLKSILSAREYEMVEIENLASDGPDFRMRLKKKSTSSLYTKGGAPCLKT